MLHDFFSAPWTNGAAAAAGMEGWSVGGKHFSFFEDFFQIAMLCCTLSVVVTQVCGAWMITRVKVIF